MSQMAGQSSAGGTAGTIRPTAESNHPVADETVSLSSACNPIRFDRRCEPRARTNGWAQLLCSNPYYTFLGGTKELADFSQHGIGMLSDCAIPEGEVVEVRLMPFKIHGKLGVVTRCEKINDADESDNTESSASESRSPSYCIGISFHRAFDAA